MIKRTLTDYRFFAKRTNFLSFFYWTNGFFEQTFGKTIFFLQNERFYQTIVSDKTTEIDGKWTIILRLNEIIFLRDLKNERNEKRSNVSISTYSSTKAIVHKSMSKVRRTGNVLSRIWPLLDDRLILRSDWWCGWAL